MTAESDWSPSESRAHVSKPQFLITSNAFYPIKDDFALDKMGDRKLTDSMIRPLENRIAALEKSRKDLENDVAHIRKDDDDRKPKKEDLMRSNTDLITHLSYKMQVLAESVASLKGKVQGVEGKSSDQQGTLRDMEKTLAKIENTVLSSQDEQLSKQSNELLMVRDVMAELRAKIDQQQRPRKEDQDLASEVSRLQRVIEGLRAKQDSTERELERVRRKQEKDGDQEDWIRQLVDERCQRIIQKEEAGPKLSQLAKTLAEEKAARQEFQQKMRDMMEKGLEEHKLERQDETKKLRELVKSDKARTNASLHKLNDAMINVMEKQMDEQKVNQEKLQAEVIARQQFECDILKKLIDIDERTTRLSKHVNEVSGSTHKVREELRNELEAKDNALRKANKDLELKVAAGKKKPLTLDDDSDWRGRTDLAINQLRQEIRLMHEASKDQDTEAKAGSKKLDEIAANNKKMNGSLAEMQNFKNETLTALDALDKKIKNANKKRPVVVNEPTTDGAAANDAIQDQLKAVKEKIKKDDDQLRLLRKDLDQCAKKEDLDKLRKEWVQNADNNANEKAQNEKIRMLANAIQVTKGVVAMKMQHEEKMRLETMDHLQDQIDKIEKDIEKLKRDDDDDYEEVDDEEAESSEGKDKKKKDKDEDELDSDKDKKKNKGEVGLYNDKDKKSSGLDNKDKKKDKVENGLNSEKDKKKDNGLNDKDKKKDKKENGVDSEKDDDKEGEGSRKGKEKDNGKGDKEDKKDGKEKRDKDEKKADGKEKPEKKKESTGKGKDVNDADTSRQLSTPKKTYL